jgi:hypothetical protein
MSKEEYPYRIILWDGTILIAEEYHSTAINSILRIDLTNTYEKDTQPNDMVKNATIFPGSKPVTVVKVT